MTLDKIGSPLSAQEQIFAAGAEVVEGTYRGSSGEGTLVADFVSHAADRG